MSDSTQLSDSYLYAETIAKDPPISVSKGKNVITVSDKNQGSYTSGVVEIDASTALKGSSNFASFDEMYLTVPYKVSLKNLTALSDAPNQYALTLKCGVWNIIDSLRLELNSREILSGKQYINHWANIRAMSEWSPDQVQKHGADAFLYPDNWYSCAFSSSASGSGDGFVYNKSSSSSIVGTTPTNTALNGNEGFIKRLLANPMPVETGADTYGWPTLSSSASGEVVKMNEKGAFKTGGSVINAVSDWLFYLKIRLSDLHPIFKSIKLCANTQCKLTISFNTGYVDVAGTAATPSLMSMTSIVNRGKSCPIMIASALEGEPLYTVLRNNDGAGENGVNLAAQTGAKSFRVAYGVLENDVSAFDTKYTNSPYVGLNIPYYSLQPDKVSRLISDPIKKIRFLDFHPQWIAGSAGRGRVSGRHGANFETQLSGSFKNIKYVLLLPYSETSSATIGGNAANHFATLHGAQQFESLFDAAPWTQQAGSAIKNFQILIGNDYVFTGKQMSYDHQLFLDEISKLNSINGGVPREVSNGLLDFKSYSTVHRFLLADCSRISNPEVVQSITISGTNESSQGSNFLAIVVYERELDLNLITGEVENLK